MRKPDQRLRALIPFQGFFRDIIDLSLIHVFSFGRGCLGGKQCSLVTSTPHGGVLGTEWILTVFPVVAGCPGQTRCFS